MRHWSANYTVSYQLLLLRQTAVEYFKFQTAMTAAKMFFDNQGLIILSNHNAFLYLTQFRSTMSTVILKFKMVDKYFISQDHLVQDRKFNSPQFLENNTLQGSHTSCRC